MSIEEPSAKKAKLSGSGNNSQLNKGGEEGENLFYFLGCNEGKENVNKKYKYI